MCSYPRSLVFHKEIQDWDFWEIFMGLQEGGVKKSMSWLNYIPHVHYRYVSPNSVKPHIQCYQLISKISSICLIMLIKSEVPFLPRYFFWSATALLSNGAFLFCGLEREILVLSQLGAFGTWWAKMWRVCLHNEQFQRCWWAPGSQETLLSTSEY